MGWELVPPTCLPLLDFACPASSTETPIPLGLLSLSAVLNRVPGHSDIMCRSLFHLLLQFTVHMGSGASHLCECVYVRVCGLARPSLTLPLPSAPFLQNILQDRFKGPRQCGEGLQVELGSHRQWGKCLGRKGTQCGEGYVSGTQIRPKLPLCITRFRSSTIRSLRRRSVPLKSRSSN